MNNEKQYKIIKKFYRNKRVLITGATGFKGAWLSFWLNKLGSNVCTIGNNPNKNKSLFYGLKLQKKTSLKILDIRNYSKLDKVVKKFNPQIIFHLAAQPLIFESYKKPKETYEINSLGTLNLLEACRTAKSLKSLICVTSDKCYESNYSLKGFKESDKLGGKDPYSGSKACAEIIVKTYIDSFFKNSKIAVATVRAGNVIGGGDWSENRLIPDAVRSINKNKTIIIRNPKFNRPWQHVLEPLYGYLWLGYKLAINKNKFSGAWNFGTNKNTVTNVEQIVQMILNFWGAGKYKVIKNKKFYEQSNLQLNITKAKKILKWTPKLTIKKSVELTVDWYMSVLKEKKNYEKITEKQIKNFLGTDYI